MGLIESIPDALQRQTADAFAISAKLGNPSATRLLMQTSAGRIPVDMRRALSKESPSLKLDSYLVLVFDDELKAQTAVGRMQGQEGIRWAGGPPSTQFSQSSPSDLLFSGVFGNTPLSKQWGLEAINAPAVWSLIDGIAYVGVDDNGLDLSHEDFGDSYFGAAYKTQFKLSVDGSPSVDELPNIVAGKGHGTHVAGLIAARHNGIGAAGVCRGCSLIMTRANTYTNRASAVSALARAGAQVINMSFGGQLNNPSANLCLSQPNDVMCVAITEATEYRTTLVAAAGNDLKQYMNFPASDARTISVGGLQREANGQYKVWNQLNSINYAPLSPSRNATAGSDEVGSNGTDPSSLATIFAPARDTLAPMYTGLDWSTDGRCGTSRYFYPSAGRYNGVAPFDGFLGSGNAPYVQKYGLCTGTSMSAPHVTGVVALIRTANPLLSLQATRDILTQTASFSSDGRPMPNALGSVQSALATSGRLTPLFILYSIDYEDYFQTIVPQMDASAVMQGVLPPLVNGYRVRYATFPTMGNAVAGFTSFFDGVIPVPKGLSPANLLPRARIRVFTTPRDAQGSMLLPLFRASYVNPDYNATAVRLRHYIAVGTADRDSLGTSSWKIDGVEGYIYPPSASQPAGTARIVRGFNPASLNWVLFPEVDLVAWQAAGFTVSTFVGYAYLN